MTTPIKMAIAQMNPTVGDYPANTEKILGWMTEAEKKRADLIVFPEMALCGYPMWDLANKKAFVDAGLQSLKRIAAATRGKKITVVLGFIDRNTSPESLPDEWQAGRVPPNTFNSVAWIENGKIRAVYHKQLLPTYDVFLENIFFRAGTRPGIVNWRGIKIGLTICEDIWDAHYKTKPLAELAKKKPDLVINISASPYYQGVAGVREKLLKSHVKRYGFPILYVNQVGGQDDLLFDGRSLMVDARGRVVFQAPTFAEGLLFHDFSPCPHRVCTRVPHPVWTGSGETGEVYQALVMGIRDYFRKNGFKKAVVGLSGGVDSALVATLAVDALGEKAVKGVTMPGPYSSEGSWKDSKELAKRLGIAFEIRPIKEMYETFLSDQSGTRDLFRGTRKNIRGQALSACLSPDGCRLQTADCSPTLAMENLQARLRGMELMFISNDEGRLVLTTGNKSELAMGYCTLYGDMAGGLAVIGDVYKTEVYRLARYRNTLSPVIPQPILTKAPSAELRPNQKDQDSLPPYEILDRILYLYIEKSLSGGDIVRKLKKSGSHPNFKWGVTPIFDLVTDIIRKVDHNEYKRRQTPPVFRVTEKAWFGRRMPITNRFQE